MLTLLGVTKGRRVRSELLVVDIGGGSCEFVIAGPDRPVRSVGISLGSARLTQDHIHSDPPAADEIDALREIARAALKDAPDAAPNDLVAVGGTASNLLRLLPATAIDRVLTRRRIAVALAMLTVERSADAAERHALRPQRARILPAGAVIVDAILERYGVDRLQVSEEGIREGAILGRLGRGGRVARPPAVPRRRLGPASSAGLTGPQIGAYAGACLCVTSRRSRVATSSRGRGPSHGGSDRPHARDPHGSERCRASAAPAQPPACRCGRRLLALSSWPAARRRPTPSTASPTSRRPPSADRGVSPSGSPPQAAFRWDAPRDGSTVSEAPPDASGGGRTCRGTSDGATVMFSIDWPGSAPQEACVAEAPTAGGVWQCEVDLAAPSRLRAGSLKLDFEVSRELRSRRGVTRRQADARLPARQRRRGAPRSTILPEGCYVPASGGRRIGPVSRGRDLRRQAIRYAEGSATGALVEHHVPEPPARHTEVAIRSSPSTVDTLYIAYTRYGPVTDAETCGPGSPAYEDLGVYYRTRIAPRRRRGRSHGGSAARATSWIRSGWPMGRIHATVVPNNFRSRGVASATGGGSTARVPLRRVRRAGPRSASGTTERRDVAYVNWRDGIRPPRDDRWIDGDDVDDRGRRRATSLNPLLVLGGGNQPHLIWTRRRDGRGRLRRRSRARRRRRDLLRARSSTASG